MLEIIVIQNSRYISYPIENKIPEKTS